ncbi:MAG: patatin-like phospholipase family protein [Marmoricola sp.]
MSTTRVALALGAGGARGYAHIGAIREIQRRGMEVIEFSGTSMGALIGGLAAHGTLDEYEEWALGLKRSDVFRLMDPSWSGPGAISADKVLEKVNELIGEVTIEQLPIHFTAVATDLAARREVWFQSGPLHAAIRASIAIPGIITPVLINGRLLVDGGLLNPVPIEPLARAAADLTIAISLAGPRAAREPESPSTESTDPQRFEVWRDRVRRTFSSIAGNLEESEGNGSEGSPGESDTLEESEVERRRWWRRWARDLEAAEPSAFQELPSGLRLSDVTALSFDAMQGMISRYRMAGLPPDIVVTVPVGGPHPRLPSGVRIDRTRHEAHRPGTG